jgi:hypothetical protein
MSQIKKLFVCPWFQFIVYRTTETTNKYTQYVWCTWNSRCHGDSTLIQTWKRHATTTYRFTMEEKGF